MTSELVFILILILILIQILGCQWRPSRDRTDIIGVRDILVHNGRRHGSPRYKGSNEMEMEI